MQVVRQKSCWLGSLVGITFIYIWSVPLLHTVQNCRNLLRGLEHQRVVPHLARFESDSLINRKNSGATANSPTLWMEVAALAHVREDSVQNVFQFYFHTCLSSRIDFVALLYHVPRDHGNYSKAEEQGHAPSFLRFYFSLTPSRTILPCTLY